MKCCDRERTIALARSSDTFVVQSRGYVNDSALGAVVWFGPHAAHGTAYVPLVVKMETVPDCLAYGWQGVYNLSTSFWAHRIVENIAQIKFNYMIENIRTIQHNLEGNSLDVLTTITNQAIPYSPSDLSMILNKNAETNRDTFLQLQHTLLFGYADGYINTWEDNVFRSSATG